ncbi:hypothetical protein PR003_g22511 [Phytophthora rubi]|uniref:Uncharacterized protein n=1 Tax=Phytophthora rubi TaxID=129364 RepID=A0A6A3H1H1_9STRA|nr:hypothetical protein PR001_g29496 [Phytophthora rubi]KAE8976696.1 hypothetical protein PR002_g25242 [Phytophthora rubi]KAE9301455.1 hypothetical protein PR003_g22511 [Phytophthora rubi]
MVFPYCGSVRATKVQELGDELPSWYYYVTEYGSGKTREKRRSTISHSASYGFRRRGLDQHLSQP